VDELRQRVARGDYFVDSRRIADSLLEKMRLIKLGRNRISPASEQKDPKHAA
jgi:hypothetical protein